MIFFYNMSFTLLNNSQDLGPSYKMDLDFLALFWKKILCLITVEMLYAVGEFKYFHFWHYKGKV